MTEDPKKEKSPGSLLCHPGDFIGFIK